MYKTVRTPLANLYSTHSFMSDQVTQALMGEKVEILDNYESWYKAVSYTHLTLPTTPYV